MKKDAEKWPYSDLAKMEVVAYGCHRKLHEELSQLFAKDGIESFQLIEYFFLEAIQRSSNNEPSTVFFPFIRWLFEEQSFLLTMPADYLLSPIPRTSNLRTQIEMETHTGVVRPRRYMLPFTAALVGKNCLRNWRKRNQQRNASFKKWFKIYSVDDWKRHVLPNSDLNKKLRDIIDVEYQLVGSLWEHSTQVVNTVVGGYPIASNAIMYGYFVIVWPEPKSTPNRDSDAGWGGIKYENIVNLLDKHSKDSYVPTLALLHNSIAEDKVYKTITEVEEKNGSAAGIASFIRTLPIANWPPDSEDVIERGIARLWRNRLGLLDGLGGEYSLKEVKDTLLVRKYNVASPGMVDQIRKIIQRAPHLNQPKERDKLPTALIYGEAGAGKDTLAQLIPLFTAPNWKVEAKPGEIDKNPQGYFGTKPNVINMSALKPNMVFGPLFLGMTIPEAQFEIPSILLQSRKKEGEQEAGVFILDELNSLDVDLQGVLLRVLENGEVRPLFGIEAEHVKHLVVGIVNEDPEILTKESETKKLEEIKDFTGEFLGGVLYESFIKGRRLRPDLFYRLSRGLYLKLPPLRERREDIPIIFYFTCLSAVLEELKNGGSGSYMPEDVYVELKAYESLMHPSLDWWGNVRQLQAVATKVAIEAVKCYENDKDKDRLGFVRVSDQTVRGVLATEFPKIFPETPGQKNHN